MLNFLEKVSSHSHRMDWWRRASKRRLNPLFKRRSDAITKQVMRFTHLIRRSKRGRRSQNVTRVDFKKENYSNIIYGIIDSTWVGFGSSSALRRLPLSFLLLLGLGGGMLEDSTVRALWWIGGGRRGTRGVVIGRVGLGVGCRCWGIRVVSMARAFTHRDG